MLFEGQCEFSTVSDDLGFHVICWCWSTVFSEVHSQRSCGLWQFLEHFMFPSADKLYGDADFIFQQDLAPAHTAKGTKSWFNDHGVTVLDWAANFGPLSNSPVFFLFSPGKMLLAMFQKWLGSPFPEDV